MFLSGHNKESLSLSSACGLSRGVSGDNYCHSILDVPIGHFSNNMNIVQLVPGDKEAEMRKTRGQSDGQFEGSNEFATTVEMISKTAEPFSTW